MKSIQIRYFAKLVGTILNMVGTLVITSIVPRSIGAVGYGSYTFLISSMGSFIAFLDSSSIDALKTKLSCNNKDTDIFQVYGILLFLCTFATLGITYCLSDTGLLNTFFPDQEVLYIGLAVCWGFSLWISRFTSGTIDALALTFWGEVIRVAQTVVKVSLICSFYFFTILDLKNFFLIQIFSLLLISFGNIIILLKNDFHVFSFNLTIKKFKDIFHDFRRYVSPLYLYTFVGLITVYFDRWLLQLLGGSHQQGYYGLADQVSIIALLFTSSLVPIFHRESSILFKEKKYSEVGNALRKSLSMLYFFSCVISIFCFVFAEDIILMIVGEEFRDAIFPVRIMLLVPLHQCYGQVVSTLFFTSNNLKLFSRMGIISMLVGSLMTYLFMVPIASYFEISGSAALAFKIVVHQFFWVHIMLFVISTDIKIKVKPFLKNQIIVTSLVLMAALLTFLIINFIGIDTLVLKILVSLCLYFLFVLMILVTGYKFENLIFLYSKEELLQEIVLPLRRKIKR